MRKKKKCAFSFAHFKNARTDGVRWKTQYIIKNKKDRRNAVQPLQSAPGLSDFEADQK